MASLLNTSRPPVFCPGCSHERVVHALDGALQGLGLRPEQVVVVSDIGCSGLFDTFFRTHAFHGLHGRALTYATGIKLARPDLTVVVTMGDGGLGIGGAHLLAACRRNLDLTLLVLNNFNFGMTGGQFSATTPPDARVGSGFLNALEHPMDPCAVAAATGAPFVARASAYQKDLPEVIRSGVEHKGFSVVEVRGVCPGRYTRRNRLTPKGIAEEMARLPPFGGAVPANARPEYGAAYREQAAARSRDVEPLGVAARHPAPGPGRDEVLLLGAAGQRVQTVGDVLALAGLSAGLRVTVKSEYNITVLRGPSVTEVILSPEDIDYTGLARPTAVVALAPEGVERRAGVLGRLDEEALVLRVGGVELPPTRARVVDLDLKALGIRRPDWALGSLAALAGMGRVVSREMLASALAARFRGGALEAAEATVERVLGA